MYQYVFEKNRDFLGLIFAKFDQILAIVFVKKWQIKCQNEDIVQNSNQFLIILSLLGKNFKKKIDLFFGALPWKWVFFVKK